MNHVSLSNFLFFKNQLVFPRNISLILNPRRKKEGKTISSYLLKKTVKILAKHRK